MRLCSLIVLVGALSSTNLKAGTPPEFIWAKSAGSSVDDYGNAVAVDSAGNSVTVGGFTGTGNFLGTNLVSSGSDDIFLLKLDSSGARVWAKRAGGSTSDEAYATALDGVGNVYAAGRFTGTANFGTTNLTSAGTHDMFLVKYDVNGNTLWARRAGGTDIDYANGVATDTNGNVFVTGVFTGSANFGGTVLTNAGSKDIFIAKYDSAGNFLWARRAGSTGTDVSFSIATDKSGNAFIAGWFVFTANFGGINITVAGSQDIFLAKYDANGNFLWVRQGGGSASYDYCYSVAVDPAGNPCISGSFRSTTWFSGTSLISAGSSDIFVAKYSANGNFLWAQKAGSPDASSPFKANDDEAYAVTVNSLGDVFVTGYLNGTATFSGTNVISSSQYQDVYIAKYSSNGVFGWVQRAGGTGGSDYGNSIAMDASGNAYVAGTYYGAATFGTNNVTSVGYRDIFTTKVSTVAATPTAPTISDITDKILNEDTSSGAIPFTVGDAETPVANLIVAANSSNPTLLSSLVLGGSGANRTLTITPAANLFGTATVTITVTDSNGMTNSDNFLVTVNSVNDVPTLNVITNIVVNEDSGTALVNFGGVTSGTGSESQLLTVTATSSNPALIPNPAVSYVSADATGSLSLAPVANASGTSTITVTVQDDGGIANGGSNSFSRTFLVTVNPVNDAPTISDIADQNINQNASTGPLPFVVGDVETAATSLVVSGNSSNTNLIPNSRIVFGGSGNNRTVTVSPATNQVGSAMITIFVNDGTTNASDSFLVTVSPVNSAPTISGITNRVTNEDTPTAAIPFTVSDNQTAATNLILSAGSSNTNLVPNVNIVFGGSGTNRTLVVTPAPNQFGSNVITVSVSDGTLTTNTSFVLTVNAVNDAPTLNTIGALNLNEDSGANGVSLDGITSGASNENQLLTVTATSSNPALIPNPSVNYVSASATGSLSFSPVANINGTSTITVTVQDDGGTANGGSNSLSRTFLVTVNPVNDAPAISVITNRVTNEDAPTAAIPFAVSDVETSATNLVVSAVSSDTNLVPNANVVFSGNGTNRSFVITPLANQFGTSLITISVGDGSATTNNSFLLTVNSVNDVPTLNALSPVILNEDSGTNVSLGGITFGASNENQFLTVTATSSNPALVPNPAVTYVSADVTGSLSLAPVANASGTSTITVTVQDDGGIANGGSNSFSRTFLVTVNPVNDAPTISDIADQNINQNASTGPLPFVVGDVETAATSLVVSGNSSNTNLIPNSRIVFGGSGNNRTVTISPATNQVGSATITIFVNDGTTNASDSFLVTVNSVNSAPIISGITNRVTNEDTPTAAIPFTVSDNQTAATNLILSAGSSNTNLVPNVNIVFGGSGTNRTLVVTPAPNQFGSNVITVSVSDGILAANTSFLLTINPVNDAPVAVGDNYVITEGGTLNPGASVGVLATDWDVETNLLTAILVTGTTNGTLIFNSNGSFTYVQNGSETTTDSFKYKVNDGALDSGVATVNITITPMDDAPWANNDSYTVAKGGTLKRSASVGVLMNDTDAETNSLLATLVTAPANGTLTFGTNGSFTYFHNGSQMTNDSFTYRASDGILDSGLAIVSLTVTSVNHAPTFGITPPQTVNEGATLMITNSATDEDSGDVLSFALLSGPFGVSVTTNGILSWTPTEGQGPNTNVISIRVSDNGTPNLSSTNLFTVVVNEVNSAPTISPITNRSINAGTTLLVTNAATDPDVPANTLTFSLLSALPGANLTANGIFSWTPANTQAGSTNLVVLRVTDNGIPSLSRTSSFFVIVPPIGEELPKIEKPQFLAGNTRLSFSAQAGQPYRIDYAGGTNAPWLELMNIPAPSAATNLVITDSVYDSNRIYRLVLPDPPTQIDRLTRNSEGVRIFFAVQAGRPYQVQGQDLFGATWTVLTNVTPAVTTSSFTFFDTRKRGQQFYRLATPLRQAAFNSIQKTPSVFSFQFAGKAGTNYVVEYQQAIAPNAWSPLTNITPVATTNVLVFDNALPAQQRFYRVKVN